MDDLLREFLTETGEHLDTVDVELVRFEQDPNNETILRNIFRLVHTIKGTCGFLGLPRLEALAHAAETLMGKFRDGHPVTTDAVSLILQTLDRIKEIVAELERTAAEPEGEDQDLIGALDAMSNADPEALVSQQAGSAQVSSEAPADTAADDAPEAGGFVFQQLERDLLPGEIPLDELERAFMEAPGPDDEEGVLEEIEAPVVMEGRVLGEPDEAPVEEAVAGAPVAAAAPVVDDRPAESKPAPAAKKPEVKDNPGNAGAEQNVAKVQTIRVNVDTLEHLMTMVSELVLTRNQLLEIARREDDSGYKVPLQRLSHVTAELQEGVMKTRMQPIGTAWQKLPRVIRDLSSELGKKIELVMQGADTELDRQVLEVIKDPLTHMIRNSADHGIEDAEARRAAGKPERGTIRLNAYHEGGTITIEIADDGKGLNYDAIARKIVSQGLATEAEIERMSEAQMAKYIFHPGFSTAAQVTAVSGRGVGMDVVKTNIELIGGTVEIRSEQGKGTVFTIKIPLTLAIVAALIVSAQDQRFAIPQVSVLELVRVKNGSDHQIERINGTPVLRLRDRLLPIVPIGKVLGLDGAEANPGDEGFVVVSQVGRQRFGILVDGVFHTEEIVVKPMATKLRHIPMFSGNTILGDGAVVLIIDPNGIAKMVGQGSGDTQFGVEAAEDMEESNDNESTTLLVFRGGGETHKAVPLSLVTRLEEIDAAKIEWVGGRPLIQYRGKLMPLVPADPAIAIKSEGPQALVVFSDGERAMGLVVDEIVDIIDDVLDIELVADRPDLLGSAVLRGRATEIVNVVHYLPLAHEDWTSGAPVKNPKDARTVLLVDDSSFFREMLSPVLKAAGYRVITAAGTEQALAALNADRRVDAIVADVDMPGRDGFALIRAVRAQARLSRLPVIALSSAVTPEAIEEARKLDISEFIAKFDRSGLVAALAETEAQLGEAA
ncbi:MAG: chemotaxis signal relay system histidine kinase CheA [Saliniramus fredricksonii]|uniref:Chemotaxis protein CheA n=1 Tax=Saliniramus fredricksonii TaxID=1653334 RepID=A0A0P7XA81_9HYPH|nr:chemotaxis protein CheW [Saliniramus fredricksonii]KPQ12139.1 MAG: chemotaxis signal relay system histidine kinase CheA [Saliniramus fredricksonii]SCC78750.1 two-component system, chemotaxis family, sensor kinase CheA [Saliniramus fredricksonii]